MNQRFTVPIDEDLREYSDEVVFLPGRGAADWARIFAHAEPLRLEDGETLVLAGVSDRALYFLIDGRVRVGLNPVFKTIDAPSVLGEVAFLDGGPRSVTLIADGDVEAARFSLEHFEALGEEEPDLARAIALDLGRIAALRLRLVSRHLSELTR